MERINHLKHKIRLTCLRFCKNSCSFNLYLCIIPLILLLIFIIFPFILEYNPETELLFNGMCKNNGRAWNGKILGYQIFDNSFLKRRKSKPNSYKNYNVYRAEIGDRRLHNEEEIKNGGSNHDIIMFGTHHKSGTAIATKLMSSICIQMKWCCIMHVTRDTYPSLIETIDEERTLRMIGHSQWIWHPQEFAIPNYKFIHFFRDPFEKIVSGYIYHRLGSELWTKKKFLYHKPCELLSGMGEKNPKLGRLAKKPQYYTAPDGSIKVDHREDGRRTSARSRMNRRLLHWNPGDNPDILSSKSRSLNRSQVMEFCNAIHLCPACCRREHERSSVLLKELWDPKLHSRLYHMDPGHNRTYFRRSKGEYTYLCAQLRTIKGSLHETLQKVDQKTGLRIEAALQYYENLRMARIVNRLSKDEKTMSIDLSDVQKHYKQTIMKILNYSIPSEDVRDANTSLNSLSKSLNRFDANSGTLSRIVYETLSYMTPGHISPASNNDKNKLLKQVKHDKIITAFYKPVYELLLEKDERQSGIRDLVKNSRN